MIQYLDVELQSNKNDNYIYRHKLKITIIDDINKGITERQCKIWIGSSKHLMFVKEKLFYYDINIKNSKDGIIGGIIKIKNKNIVGWSTQEFIQSFEFKMI